MKKETEIVKESEISEEESIEIIGANVHNLKNINLSIPRNKLVVVTGLSGSGKSSLAFDTIYAEGQRRYIETFSAYARQFLGGMERPDVEKITGLSPVIAIEQKTTSKNPRSTVGTVTEIYDYLRLLFSRASEAYSHITNEKMVKYTDEQIVNMIVDLFNKKSVYVLAPLVKGRKGHYRELFINLRKKGFLEARINGTIKQLIHGMKLDRYKTHNIELVVDKIKIEKNQIKRIKQTLPEAMKQGKGVIMILEKNSEEPRYFSRHLMCPSTGISYNEPEPHSFSFNSPVGACPKCNGLGEISEIDIKKIIPDDSLSIEKGGIFPIGKKRSELIFWMLESLAEKHKFSLSTAICDLSEEHLNLVLYGSGENLSLKNTPLGRFSNYSVSFGGIINHISNRISEEKESSGTRKKSTNDQFVKKINCPDCNGSRLKSEALQFKIADKNIADLSNMDINELYTWFNNVEKKLTKKQKAIASEIIKELQTRISFLINVGLTYLTLSRSAKSLSGGESQRIRLATQIGSQLVNVLYILDEPSIGLHQRDNVRLIDSLKALRDAGNSIIVVEHDKEMILSADHVVDLGPFAGRHGGEIVASGNIREILKKNGLTSDYLTQKKLLSIPKKRREGNGQSIVLKKASGHNLKNVSVDFPLGKLICVTGVSGSGKSSLINGTLHPILSRHFYRSHKSPLDYKNITGLENIDKVIEVDQSPIGRTPRSNPVTYTNIFGDIRKIFEMLPESKIRGYKAGRFSFNVKGGRCESCQGAGLKTIEMNFLPDVYVHCEDCNGKRYNRETLEVRYKGKSIYDVLEMTINQAVDFFEGIPKIRNKLKAIQDVGLGYITLGQPSTTLSGGESQRVKLSAELSKRDTGKTLYILDEPTTGLHFEDIRVLMDVLDRIVDRGNTVIIIEHNLDVIKKADHIIDLGPEGGKYGGKIIAEGTPEEIILIEESHTARYLKQELN